jgi:hypothetical protein
MAAIEWRIQDFQKKGRVTCECKLFQPFWVPIFEIFSTYFILKNLVAKGCVCISKSATEIVYLLIFQVIVLDQLCNFKLLALRIAMLCKQPSKKYATLMVAILNTLQVALLVTT